MKFRKRIVIATVMMAMIITGSSMSAEAAKFNPAFYSAKYADVRAAYGSDVGALYNHYLNYGQKEGRVPDANVAGGAAVDGIIGMSAKFNPAFYAAKYADVRAAFGMNADALYNHYITCGQKEGRMPFAGATGGETVNGIATAAEIQAMQTPVTYYVKYVQVNDKSSDWRFQKGKSTWDGDGTHRDLYYMKQSIKDGDILIVDCSDRHLDLSLPVALNNITFVGPGTGVIRANSVENVYVLKNCTGVVNGNVTNAYVYDDAVANFNNNVTNLHIMEVNANDQTIGVLGTVDYMANNMNGRITRQLYSFRKNTFRMEKGTLKTDDSDFRVYPIY